MTFPVVVVSGGNSGIGFALVGGLLERNYRVAVLDISGEQLAILQQHWPDRLRYYRCDIADQAQVDMVIADVLREWGRIDILVNNAATALFRPFAEKTLDELRYELDVNFFGAIHLIKAVLPAMQAQGGGIIHNVSSGVGFTGFPGLSGYTASKGALESLTRTLALEVAPLGITLNVIHPPLTNTKSAAPLGVPSQMMADPAQVGQQLAAKVGMKRPIITPDRRTALGLQIMRHFPIAMGRLLARLTQRARRDSVGSEMQQHQA